MALSVDDIYKFALALIKKNQAGGLKSTDFQRHWNDTSATYQDDLLGRFQAKNTGKEGANTGLIQDETIIQKLAPFITPVTLTIAAGVSNKPADFIYKLALRINGNKVFKVTHDEIWAMNEDVIDPPSVTDNSYYYAEYEGYYQFFPNTVTSADLDYVATPTDVVWGFTLDGDGRQVYDAGTSVQPLWDNNSCREITKRMLTNLGVGFKDADFANFGSKVQTMGE
jgi:hypothetical protein